MIFYLFLAFLIIVPTIFFNVNKDLTSKKIYLIYAVGIMTILGALRKYTIGIDSEIIYYPYFNLVKNVDNFVQLGSLGIEFGFAVFLKLLSYISKDYQIFLIFTSLISFVTFGYFVYKNSEDVGISCIVFLLTANYFMELNVVRQSCAIAFIMLAYELYKNKKNLFALLLVLLATSFHSSAIIFLIVPFFKNIKFTKLNVYLLFIFTVILLIFLPQFVEFFSNLLYKIGLTSNKNYVSYLTNKVHGVSYIDFFSLSEVVISLGIFLLGLYSYKLKNSLDFDKKNYKNILFFSYFYFLFNFLALRITVIRRAGLYFLPFSFVLYSNSLKLMKNKYNKFLINMIFMLCIGLRYVYMIFGLAETLFGVLPYVFFWE